MVANLLQAAFVGLHAPEFLAWMSHELRDCIAPVGHELYDVSKVLHDRPLIADRLVELWRVKLR
jgi:hypothetical protein